MPEDPRIPHGSSPIHRIKGGVGDKDALRICGEILKEGYICHVAHHEIVSLGDEVTIRPKSVPMVYAYDEKAQVLYLHGSLSYPTTPPPASLKHLWSEDGVPVCLSITLVDGIAVGRAAISTSLAYRSLVVDGVVRKLDPKDRARVIKATCEQVVPGRWPELRPLDDPGELDTDQVSTPTIGTLSLSLTESTTVMGVKERGGLIQHEREADRQKYPWAGELPILRTFGEPVLDVGVLPTTPIPPSVQALIDRHGTDRTPDHDGGR